MLKINNIILIYQIIYFFIILLSLGGEVFSVPHIRKYNCTVHAQYDRNNFMRQLYKEQLDFIHYLLLFWWFKSKQRDNVIMKNVKCWHININA